MAEFDTVDRAVQDADDAAGSMMDAFLRRIADRVGARSGATAVYGTPVSSGGVTIVPVARARWGFGGGAGEGGEDDDRGSGAGGGGGAASSPVGYIEIADGGARFVSISDPARVWPVVLASGVTAWLVLRGLRSLFRSR